MGASFICQHVGKMHKNGWFDLFLLQKMPKRKKMRKKTKKTIDSLNLVCYNMQVAARNRVTERSLKIEQ